jgi:hypothetical protein
MQFHCKQRGLKIRLFKPRYHAAVGGAARSVWRRVLFRPYGTGKERGHSVFYQHSVPTGRHEACDDAKRAGSIT